MSLLFTCKRRWEAGPRILMSLGTALRIFMIQGSVLQGSVLQSSVIQGVVLHMFSTDSSQTGAELQECRSRLARIFPWQDVFPRQREKAARIERPGGRLTLLRAPVLGT